MLGLDPAPAARATSLSPIDFIYARKLHETVVRRAEIRRRFSLEGWAKQFSLLRGGVGQDRIDAALTWYESHCRDEYTPQAWSGQAFRKKFLQIEGAMARWQKRNPVVVRTEDTEVVLQHLRLLLWPHDSKQHLADAVQLSIDAVTAYKSKLRALLLRHGDGRMERTDRGTVRVGRSTELSRYAQTILGGPLRNTTQFVRNWFEGINSWLQRIPSFHGDLRRLVVDPTQQKFAAAASPAGWPESLWSRLQQEVSNA